MSDPVFPGRSFFHGTKANLKTGDLIEPGYTSNYGQRATAAYVYLGGWPILCAFCKGWGFTSAGPMGF